jgi:hypothetical protein
MKTGGNLQELAAVPRSHWIGSATTKRLRQFVVERAVEKSGYLSIGVVLEWFIFFEDCR